MPAEKPFVFIGLDGLRPDLITPSNTPNICGMRARGLTLSRFRTVFPSDTRVAFPSYVTGAPPSSHGAVGNRFIDRSFTPSRYVDTASSRAIDEFNADTWGRFLGVPTLGDILAPLGGQVAVLSTDSRGSTRILNPKAPGLGQISLSGHFREFSTPVGITHRIEADLGLAPDEPAADEPDIAGQTYLTDAFLRHVWPEARPDVTMIWYSEPDRSSHNCGTAHYTTLEALRHCDHEVGRLLSWWDAEGREAGVQLCLVSDHGHVTGHHRVSVAAALQQAGLSAQFRTASDYDVGIVTGQTVLLYVADQSATGLARVAEAMMAQPWCGPLFGPGRNDVEGVVAGTFAKSLVMADHERSPDFFLTFRSDDALDGFGLPGRCAFDGSEAEGLGTHGGLHPRELAATCILLGDAYEGGGKVSETPAGVCDLAPTLLHIQGLTPPPTMSGRLLTEVLAGVAPGDRPWSQETFETGQGNYRQSLRRLIVDEARYLDGAWNGRPT